MLTEEEKSIISFIRTGEEFNITLALQLMKGNKQYGGIVSTYKYLFDWLVKHKLLKHASSTDAKINGIQNRDIINGKMLLKHSMLTHWPSMWL